MACHKIHGRIPQDSRNGFPTMGRQPLTKSQSRCLGKVRYSDELGARATASVLCTSFGRDELFVYKCPHCIGWHATKKQAGNFQKAKVTPDTTFVFEHRHEYGADGKCVVCRDKNPAMLADEAVSRWRARHEELRAAGKNAGAKQCLEEVRNWEFRAHRIRIKMTCLLPYTSL